MRVFINEKSLQSQFNATTIVDGVKKFIETVDFLNKLEIDKKILKSQFIFNENAIAGMHLSSSLANNRDLRQNFLQAIQNSIVWNKAQLHDSQLLYSWNEDIVTDTSIAENTEHQIQKTGISALFNFSNCNYSNHTNIDILKEPDQVTNLHCIHNLDSLKKWLRIHKIIEEHDEYDETKKIAPFDDQTVLIGEEFEITTYKNRGRRAYRLKGTNQLWAVDDSKRHIIGKPHLEVFSEIDGKHLGTSFYNEINLDTTRAVNLRKIILRHYPID